jgi:hypothetical protein
MGTTEELRREIDAGRTGDKVKAGDPAAAPLGTDEEAAGTPVSPEAVELTRSREVIHDKPQWHDSFAGPAVYIIALACIGLILTSAILYYGPA